MRRMINLFLIMVFYSTISSVFAFDWKQLHEEVDRLTVEKALERVEADPGSLEALYVLGLAYLNVHREVDAEKFFALILRKDPKNYEALWGVAEVKRRQHDIDESEKFLRKIIAEHADFAPAIISLAYIKYIQADFKSSVAFASRVIQAGREKVDVSNYTRGYLLVAGGKGMLAYYGGPMAKITNGREVFPNLRKAEQLQPDSPAVHFGLGSYYFLSPKLLGGNRQKALEHLLKAVAGDPLFVDAYVRLAQVYKLNGDEKNYLYNLSKAKEIDPGNPLLLDMEKRHCKFICVSTEQ